MKKGVLITGLFLTIFIIMGLSVSAGWWDDFWTGMAVKSKNQTKIIQTCNDTDGGIVYDIAGTVTVCKGKCKSYADKCSGTSGNLQEKYCKGTNVGTKNFKCPTGCKDGACIGTSIKCYSNADCPSIQGKNYCMGNDACANVTYYKCVNPGEANANCEIDTNVLGTCEICPYGCKDGACMQGNITNNTISAEKPSPAKTSSKSKTKSKAGAVSVNTTEKNETTENKTTCMDDDGENFYLNSGANYDYPGEGACGNVDYCNGTTVYEAICPSAYACPTYKKYNCPYGCKDGACIKSTTNTTTTVKEQVQCGFKNSKTTQKCYSDNGFSCSGTEACFAYPTGPKGQKVTWKSTCGGYGYTTMDGVNEYVVFTCTTNTTNATATTTQSATATKCTDSDITSQYTTGKNYAKFGTACDSKGCQPDKCNNAESILEWYCYSSTQKGSISASCKNNFKPPRKCVNGVCVPT